MLQSTPRLPHLVPCTGLAHGNLSIMGYQLAWSPSILSPFLPLSPTLSWRTSPPWLYLTLGYFSSPGNQGGHVTLVKPITVQHVLDWPKKRTPDPIRVLPWNILSFPLGS